MSILPQSSAARMMWIVVLTLGLCTLLVQIVDYPLGWIYVLLACACLGLVACTRSAWAQVMGLGLASLGIVLGVAELYLTSQNISARAVRTYNGQYAPCMLQDDALLGFAPVPQVMQVREVKSLNGRVVYDVVHSTDAEGRRITPQHPAARKAVFFFGCSFTAGVGVNDQDVYPYVVAQILGPEYQVYNLGVGGYGPHQFLALLQSAKLDTLFGQYDDIHIFFMSMDGHEKRAGGLVEWDANGPRYVLEQGRLERKGSFAQAAPLGTRFDAAVKRSALYRDVLLGRLQWRRSELLALQQAIFVQAQDYVQKRTGSSLTLLLMPEVAGLAPALQKAGLKTLDLTTALPGWPDPARYEIPDDRHPTPEAHNLMARSIAAHIQEQQTP